MVDFFSKNYKRVLITGGAGFIGGALIRKLLIKTNSVIYNLDKMGYASDLNSIEITINSLKEYKKNRHFHLKSDLNNLEAINEALAFSNPDVIFHLAAESHVDRSIHGPSQFVNSNILGTFNLLEAVRSFWLNLTESRRNKFKLIHISTDEVFGSLSDKGKFNELSPYKPRSPYSASKAASDHLVNAWHHTYGLPTIITNCSNNYGPWQYPEKLIPVIIKKAINQEKIPIYGDGLNIRDWIYVEDHISALLTVLEKGIIGESYCIGGNNEITNIELANYICKLFDKKLPKSTSYINLIEFIEDRLGHDKRYAIDSEKIQNCLGWEPETTFERGIDITIDWYLENLNWLKK